MLGRDISVGQGHTWRRGKRHEGTVARTQEEKLRRRIWGLLWAASVILSSLCDVPIASSHQYVGLLIASMGIFIAGLMPSNHTRSYLLKEKFIVKCQASDDLPWACSWVFEFGQC